MSDAGIGFGSGQEQDLPPVNLPSWGGNAPSPVKQPPIKIEVTKGKQSDDKDFWSQFPDAPKSEVQNAPQEKAAAPTKGEEAFWAQFPDAPKQAEQPPSFASDIGETLAKNTIPEATIGRVTWPLDVANLGKAAEGWVGKQVFNQIYPEQPLTNEELQSLYAPMVPGTAEITQSAEKALGMQPYEPHYPSTQMMNTVGQAVLARNPIGAPSVTAAQAATMGLGAGAAQQLAPDNPLAAVAGGAAGVLVHQPSAIAVGKLMDMANNAGYGQKVMSLPSGISATQGQVNRAAENIKNAATNPQQLEPSLAPSPIVSGSNPTMAELSPDQGIAQYQDAARTNNPAAFQARTEEQQTAREAALHGIIGQGDTANVGQFFVNHLLKEDTSAKQAREAAETAVQQKSASVAKYGESPKEGGIVGDTVGNAQKVRKEQERSAWSFLDKYTNTPADRMPVISAANDLRGSIDKLAGEELSSGESKLYENISKNWPSGEVNIGTLKKLRTSINDAQQEVKPGSQAYMRLAKLKNSVDKALENTVNGLITHEKEAVAHGRMPAENSLISQIRDWYGKQSASAAESGGISSRASKQPTSAGQEAFTRTFGTEEQKGGKPAKPSGSKSSPPAFGKEQQSKYNAARALTFKDKVLTELETSGVVKPDGTIDPARYDRWFAKNRNKFKEHSEFREQLSNWKSAQEELNKLRATQETERKAFQKSRAEKLIGNDVTSEISNIFANKRTEVKEFSDLVAKLKADPDALEGLKAAIGEHIYNNIAKAEREEIQGETRGKIRRPQVLRDFIKMHKLALREIYGGGQELQDLEAVANDIKREQAMYERMKIRGQSNTAKDMLQASKQQSKSVLGRIMEHGSVVVGALGALHGHTGSGVLLGEVMEKASNAFHGKGLDTVKAIELEMLLHPSTFGRAMLQQVKTKDIPIPIQKRIASTLLKTLPQEGIISSNNKD